MSPLKLKFESGMARESTDCTALLYLRLEVVSSRGKKAKCTSVLTAPGAEAHHCPPEAAKSPGGTTVCSRHPNYGTKIYRTAAEMRHGTA